MPKIYAHRGGAGYFAENTLKAFEFAIELGCAGAELDVHLTKDGEVVVHHNDKLNHKFARKADGNWITPEEETPLSQLTLEQVQQYTVGEPNPKTHNHKTWPNLLPEPNQTIPTLVQVIELAKEKSDSFELLIEIKTDIFDTNKAWLPLVEKVLDIVQQNHFIQRVKFCSFNWNALLYIQQQAPEIPLWFTTHPLSWLQEGEVPKTDIPPRSETLQNIRQAWLSGNAPWYAGQQPTSFEDLPKVIKQLGGAAWFCYHTDATTVNLTKTHDQQLKLATWSVNLRDADVLEKLNLVDAICVDYPKYRFVKPSAELKNFLAIADQARKEKKWQQAEHYYQLILDAYPEQSPVGVYTGLAICQRMEKKLVESNAVLSLGLKLFPNNCSLFVEYAALNNIEKKWRKAALYWGMVYNLRDSISSLNLQRYILALENSELFENALSCVRSAYKKSLDTNLFDGDFFDSFNSTHDSPVDVVIAWVDGNDISHQEKISQYRESVTQNLHSSAVAARRFADNKELLYNLRSIKKYAPWVRNVWIITDNQIPKYIDAELAQQIGIYFVDHLTIFRGYEGVLPTFNSRTIGTMFWRIPGISDRIIYLNDDFFFTSETKVSDFFDGAKPVLRGAWSDYTKRKSIQMHHYGKINGATLAGLEKNLMFDMAHVAHAFNLKTLEYMYHSFYPEFIRNISFKFRDKSQFLISSFHHNFALLNDLAVYRNSADTVQIHYKVSQDSSVDVLDEFFSSLNHYKLGCLNNASAELMDKVRPYLDNVFDNKLILENG